MYLFRLGSFLPWILCSLLLSSTIATGIAEEWMAHPVGYTWSGEKQYSDNYETYEIIYDATKQVSARSAEKYNSAQDSSYNFRKASHHNDLNKFFDRLALERNKNSKNQSKITKINRLYRSLKIALVLPKTGKYSRIGSELTDASSLAIDDIGGRSLNMVLIDNESGKLQSESIAKYIHDNKFDLVIGPVLGQSTVDLAIALKNLRSKTKIISLSNDRTIEQNNTTIFGYSQNDDIESMTSFFTARNKVNFLALFPNTFASSQAFKVFKKSLKKNGGNLMHFEFYSKSEDPNSSSRIGRLLKNLSQTIIINKETSEIVELESEEEEFDPEIHEKMQVDADVVYIGAHGPELEVILSAMKHRSNRITDGGVVVVTHSASENASITDSPNLNNTYFFSTGYYTYQRFKQRFYQEYKYHPSKLSTVLYDAILYAAYSSQNGILDSPDTHPGIVSLFEGLNGRLTLTDNRYFTRYPVLMKFSPSGPYPILGDVYDPRTVSSSYEGSSQ